MKKLLALLVMGVVLFSSIGCGGDTPPAKDKGGKDKGTAPAKDKESAPKT